MTHVRPGRDARKARKVTALGNLELALKRWRQANDKNLKSMLSNKDAKRLDAGTVSIEQLIQDKIDNCEMLIPVLEARLK